MNGKDSKFFWPSFTDLMTSLFFIMLVLYILTFLKLKNQVIATQNQLDKIEEIQAAVKELPEQYFQYDPIYKRFSLVRNIRFATGKAIINSNDKQYLINVGNAIKSLIENLKTRYRGQDIKYVVIIEGMASKDNYYNNYSLSYKRALAVWRLWKQNGIVPDQSVAEVQIAGSGTGGIGRYDIEKKNQRILIQIVPKIGQIKVK